jgi:hypothetical protein
MAKTIKLVEHVITNPGPLNKHANVARVTIECPVSELAALLVLAGLTNAVAATLTNRIVALGDTG